MKPIFFFALVLLWCSCSDMDTMEMTPEPKPPTFGDLQVEVLKCLNPPNCQMTKPIAGAQVFVYNNEEDQTNGRDEARIGSTNAEGISRFNSLDSFLVYITVINDTFINRSFERVPQNSLSLHQVIFQ